MRKTTTLLAIAVIMAVCVPISSKAHIPDNCIPPGFQEALDRKNAATIKITNAAKRDQLMEVLVSVGDFLKIDAQVSKMFGSILRCFLRPNR